MQGTDEMEVMDLQTLNDILIMIASTVINIDTPPSHVDLGTTKTIPNIYMEGHKAYASMRSMMTIEF